MYSWPGRCWKTSGSCCTCTLGSCGYVSELSVVAQWNHWDYYFTMLYHFLAIRNKPPSPMLQTLNREEWYNTRHEPSQQARTQSLCGSNLTRIMNNNTIMLEYTSKPPLNRIRIQRRIDFMWIHVNASYVHPMQFTEPMWTCLSSYVNRLSRKHKYIFWYMCFVVMYDVVEWVLWYVIYVL